MSTSRSPRLMKSVPSPTSRVQATRRCGAGSRTPAPEALPPAGDSRSEPGVPGAMARACPGAVPAARSAGAPADFRAVAGSGAPESSRGPEQPARASRRQAQPASVSLIAGSTASVIRKGRPGNPPGPVGGRMPFIVACPVPSPAAAL